MSGTKELDAILATLAPNLDASIYTFATVSEADLSRIQYAIGTFRESEGISVICQLEEAQALKLKYEGRFSRITLTVHSSLYSVGLTARVATALAKHEISCNVVAGFHHDHLFVPAERAGEAMEALNNLK